jgi:Flp pilus assembly protein TadG
MLGRLRQPGRRERGAAAVEASIVIPVVLLVIFGMIDFGSIYNDYISLRQGLREGAREGIVSTVPQPNSGSWAANGCQTTGITPSGDGYDLICLTKSRMGLNQANTRISIAFTPQALPAAPFSAGQGVVFCAQYQTGSLTGVLSVILNNKVVSSMIESRIEQDSFTFTSSVAETPFKPWPAACTAP